MCNRVYSRLNTSDMECFIDARLALESVFNAAGLYAINHNILSEADETLIFNYCYLRSIILLQLPSITIEDWYDVLPDEVDGMMFEGFDVSPDYWHRYISGKYGTVEMKDGQAWYHLDWSQGKD